MRKAREPNDKLDRATDYSDLLLLFQGIVAAHYDTEFRSHHQLCLSILKRFGFGQRVMETRILMEVEEMINKVREEQGRPFEMSQLTASCVGNVIMNMIYGYRFDHSDAAFQAVISANHERISGYSVALEMLPLLRFLPYYKKFIAKHVKMQQTITRFIDDNIATCIEVCIMFILAYCFAAQFAAICSIIPFVCGNVGLVSPRLSNAQIQSRLYSNTSYYV